MEVKEEITYRYVSSIFVYSTIILNGWSFFFRSYSKDFTLQNVVGMLQHLQIWNCLFKEQMLMVKWRAGLRLVNVVVT